MEEDLPLEDKTLIGADSYIRSYPVWSPDGGQFAYFRHDRSGKDRRLMTWSGADGEEMPPTDRNQNQIGVTDWSSDGRTLLIC